MTSFFEREHRYMTERARRKFPSYYDHKDVEEKVRGMFPLTTCQCGGEPIMLDDVLYRPEYDARMGVKRIDVINGRKFFVRCKKCLKETLWHEARTNNAEDKTEAARIAALEWNGGTWKASTSAKR